MYWSRPIILTPWKSLHSMPAIRDFETLLYVTSTVSNICFDNEFDAVAIADDLNRLLYEELDLGSQVKDLSQIWAEACLKRGTDKATGVHSHLLQGKEQRISNTTNWGKGSIPTVQASWTLTKQRFCAFAIMHRLMLQLDHKFAIALANICALSFKGTRVNFETHLWRHRTDVSYCN